MPDLGMPCPHCGEEETGVEGMVDWWETDCCGEKLDLDLNPVNEE